MKIINYIFVFILSLSLMSCSGWKVKLNGIDVNDLKNRNYVEIGAGIGSSILIHEASHYIMGKRYKTNPSFHYTHVTMNKNGLSNSEKATISRAGFIGQTIFGLILTTIPKTRGSDFTIGFTGLSFMEQVTYPYTDDYIDRTDVKNLNSYGYDGESECYSYATINGVLLYYNLIQGK